MKFRKDLTKFVEKNLYNEADNQPPLYFRTTEELKTYKILLKSKMVRSNSIAITLSLIALISSFVMTLVNLFKDFLEKETSGAALFGIVFLCGVFIAVYLIMFGINTSDSYNTGKYKKFTLMIETIDKILSEREKQ